MTLRLKDFKEAASQWSNHNAPRLGAALAYYTILSLAPLLVVVVGVAAFAFGKDAVEGQLFYQIRGFVGDQSAAFVQTMLKAAYKPFTGALATIVGILTLLFGASGVFGELRDTLNYIWEAPVKEGAGIMGMVRYRFFSFAMVLGIGFLLMVSLVLSAVLQALGGYATQFIKFPAPVLEGINFLISFLVIAFLFALIYKLIPDVPIQWEDVKVGSLMTAALFSAGKFGIGLYLGKAGVGSAYGAAGSLIVLLVWIYYSAQIFLYGAEYTQVHAKARRSPAVEHIQAKEEPATTRLQPRSTDDMEPIHP